MTYDVLIVGGGPAGLSAALALGRGRKRVLLCDAGAPRNARAVHMHNFVSRDGTPPPEFRRIARAQLATYPNVELRETRVQAVSGQRGAFEARLEDGSLHARRLLLCTGMIDQLPAIEGYETFWGSSIFQCPYCHGWEIQDRRFGVLAHSVEMLEYALFIRGWSRDVVALTNGAYPVPVELRTELERARLRVEERRVLRFSGSGGQLERVELEGGAALPLDALFARPPQRQVPTVESLGLALDPQGYVQVDAASFETSLPGVYAAGDLTTPVQGAVLAAAAGMRAAAALNHALTVELAKSGALA
jgi:thioredoxin reductase